MYLRWKKQKFIARDGAEDIWLSAQIVESHRIDGKPRQKVVMALGRIKESLLKETLPRRDFWWRVDRNLLKEVIGGELCEKFREQISVAVPKPSYREIDIACDKATEEIRKRRGLNW